MQADRRLYARQYSFWLDAHALTAVSSITRAAPNSGTAPRPRLLVVAPDFPPTPGGIQLTLHRIATLIERFTVEVVTPSVKGDLEFDRSRRITVRRTPQAPTHALDMTILNWWAIGAALRFRPTVVINGHIVTAPAAAAIRRMLGAPHCLYMWADEAARRPRLGAFAVREAAATIAVSRHTRELAIARGAHPDRVHLIPPGVDASNRPKAARAKRPTIITVARLEHRFKGHDVLVRALERVCARMPDVEWVVVGDGPLRPELEDMVARSGLTGHVRLVGKVDDEQRDAWLDRAHVFAMPSRLAAESGGEGTGIVFLEASTRGLPVIASKLTGVADHGEDGLVAVVDGETGILVDPEDPDAVADALIGLIQDPARAEEMGRAGVRHAARFGWAEIAGRVEELLLGMAGLTPGRSPG